MESLYSELQRAVRYKSKHDLEDAQSKLNEFFRRRGLEAIVNDKKTIQLTWDEDELFYEYERRLENICSDCAYVIELLHY